jgi:glycosyltransferase involved in cell wall biosynthesis
MALTVLNVAYPLARVGPDAVGGAEQVVTVLDEALVAHDHRSIVVACEGSSCRGLLLPTPAIDGPFDREARRASWERTRRAICQALDRWPIDVVHMHGVDFDRYLPPAGVPVMATLHLPPAWYSAAVFHPDRPGTYLHCVSSSQESACPPGATLLPRIGNGVTVPAVAQPAKHRDFVMCLGRICPEKGFHIALDAAARARKPLLLGGEVFPYEAHERYFREEIVTRLDKSRRFLGPLSSARKRRLLSAARCLLAPSLVPETSSLVAMEALACGTPVVAFPSGALTEIIEPERTGYLVRDEREMALAIEAASALDPEVCRDTARQRFSADRMAAQYLQRYRSLASGDCDGAAADRVA